MLRGQKRSISGYLESHSLIHRHEILYIKDEARKRSTMKMAMSYQLGDLYIRGKYLKQERSMSHHLKQFSIYPGDVTCEPSEVFEVFVEDDLVMSKVSFESLVTGAR